VTDEDGTFPAGTRLVTVTNVAPDADPVRGGDHGGGLAVQPDAERVHGPRHRHADGGWVVDWGDGTPTTTLTPAPG